jgi:hypothetical protein
MKARYFLILACHFVFSTLLFGQEVVEICGEANYVIPENVTMEQARQIALDRARMNAIENHFQIQVSQHNVTVVKNENGNSDIQLLSVGGSEGKADWLGDSKEVQYEYKMSDKGMMVISASVCGKARKITGATIDILAKILCNGTEVRYESENFKHEDDFYLFFRSPTKGYLSVYLTDMEKTYCLLPYMNETSGKREIESGKDYLFFSKKHAEQSEAAMVTEYILTCEKQTELNMLYIIFSPNEFTKANDKKNEPNLPRELSYKDFQTWLLNSQIRDKDMKVEMKSITITKYKRRGKEGVRCKV